MSTQIKAVLVGAGSRGMHVYGNYAVNHPDEIKFVAVADPDPIKREQFCKLHSIAPQYAFTDYTELFNQPQLADCAVICTQDQNHVQPANLAMAKGYHVLLEKPMATTEQECISIAKSAEDHNRYLMVCHVLRYTKFFSEIKRIIDSGVLGDIVSLHQNEDIGYWHFAHSYVRGEWHSEELSSPMILAKCCHDIDILIWLAQSKCTSVYSTGALHYFNKHHAPQDAPQRCMDGCPHMRECAYYAPNLYLTDNTDWPTSAISSDTSIEARTKVLQEGPYGRCVFHCDNDVCDYQNLTMQFENGISATFVASAFSTNMTRRIVIDGTHGRLQGNLDENSISYVEFATNKEISINLNADIDTLGHGGGDVRLMADFIDLIKNGNAQAKTLAQDSLESHLIAFAAEKSRKNKQPIFV